MSADDTPGTPPEPAADVLRIARGEALRRVADKPIPFAMLFERGDLLVEYYAPRRVDRQKPHDRDEVYIVAAGSGTFLRGEERVPFAAGDFLFVPAGTPHRFENFTDDFATWVIFFGPVGGCRPPA